MPKSKKPRKKKTSQAKQRGFKMLPEYYNLTFQYIHQRLDDDLNTQILKFRETLRAVYQLQLKSSTSRVLEPDQAFDILYNYLNTLNIAFKNIISHHSAFYWIHLYRRIGLGHIADESEKMDYSTLASVRLHVETAIFKYANLDINDLCLNQEKSYKEVLNGEFYKAHQAIELNDEKIKYIWSKYQERSEWILDNFKSKDIEQIYYLEGIGYEYWKTMALMRAIAKGSQLTLTSNGEWIEDRSDAIDRLIRIYDERLSRGQSYISTAKALPDLGLNKGNTEECFISTRYNCDLTDIRKILGDQEYIDEKIIPNFTPIIININSFLDSHKIFNVPFNEKYNFNLINVIYFFKCISELVVVYRHNLDKQYEFRYILGIFQVLQRSYAVVSLSFEDLCKRILSHVKELSSDLNIDRELFEKDLPNILNFYSLTLEKQEKISIWSQGPRPIIMPYKNSYIIDISGILNIFNNIFFGLREDTQLRGNEFERLARKAVTDKGYNLLPNRILRYSKNNYRETDLAIRIGTTLILVDCRSIERPINLFLGKPSALQNRINLIEGKFKQISTILEYIKKHPSGQNYDFSWATEVFSIAITTDPEWIWTEDKDYWLDNIPIPKIMSLEELFDFLEICNSKVAITHQ